MSRRAARNRPDRPYRPVPVRRLLLECNRRLHARGPRAFEAVAALIRRWPQVQSGIVYIGDDGMARMMGRCSKTAHRAKFDLADAGLIVLHGSGRGLRAGGKIVNARGELVSAATGYQLDPSLLKAPAAAPRVTPAPDRPRADSPAEARVREHGRQVIQRALDTLRSRAGPAG